MVVAYVLVGLSLAMGIAVGVRLFVLLHRFYRPVTPALPVHEDQLPTVSVCIPARNEMHAMTQCLERVIATTYPKMEIIVLDDGSVDNTSILIKSFAHAGVRFIEGGPLPEGWLGKVHAQHELFREASGEYILYLDVDTHISTTSIDALVAIALAENASMVSVLPTRDDTWRASVLFATLRHFWSVIAHTRHNPAAASSAWLVQRNIIGETYHALEDVRMSVAVEKNIAAYAAQSSQYRFLISSPNIGISYEKKWRSQCETSIRLLYPFFGGKLPTAFAGILALLLGIIPFVGAPLAYLYNTAMPFQMVSFMAALVLLGTYVYYTSYVWRGGWLAGGILLPVILFQELCLFIASIYAYATKTVTWKGRPIQQSARRSSAREAAF